MDNIKQSATGSVSCLFVIATTPIEIPSILKKEKGQQLPPHSDILLY
ncbi:hypothetical protein SBF1_9520001 [Candidatus Desulfosporosinus infrequens]|uniref:Uncharacterized protein n=1 Tax=Candidatus Desulfosporosinus infrequens TaxID=2043169 RepID=A0A2U3LYJ2_9FIRM|nr:hypothetical protein SBF1_9520001 [Candidatus Desulfosporosinus infrequens]